MNCGASATCSDASYAPKRYADCVQNSAVVSLRCSGDFGHATNYSCANWNDVWLPWLSFASFWILLKV